MKNYERIRKRMRELYVQGRTLEQIAVLHGVQPPAVAHHKRVDLKQGVDWDALRLSCRMGQPATEERQKEFLGALFECFAQEMPRLKEIADPRERLELLRTYSRSYAELVRAGRADPRIDVAEVSAKTLDLLVDLAIEEGRADLAAWLEASLDRIQARIAREFA